MLPVLKRLGERPWKTGELIHAVSDEFHLTLEERKTLLPSGRQLTIANRTHWAVAFLHKAGLISRVARGQYAISDRGRTVLAAPPPRITIGFLNHFPEFAAFRRESSAEKSADPSSVSEPTAGIGTPEERLEMADRDLKKELASTLLSRIRDLSPNAFEQLIIDLLVKMGYGGTRREAAERLGRSGDGGVDGVIREDSLGLDAIYIQAKRYDSTPIGAPLIQAFAGALLANGATKGVFVTASRFTQQAREMAAAYQQHRIVLIDGKDLAKLMLEHEIAVRTVQIIRVQRIDLELYDEEDPG